MDAPSESSFICPECGGVKVARTIRRNAPPLLFGSQVEADPWLGVLEIIVCDVCGYHVPAHLGERWDGLTETSVEDEWRRVYRDAAVQETLP